MEKTMILSYSLPPSPTGTATVIYNLCRHFTKDEILLVGAKNLNEDTVLEWKNPPIVKYVSWRTRPFKGAGLIRILHLPLSLILSIYYLKKHKCKNLIAVYPNNEFMMLAWLIAFITKVNFFPYIHNTFADGLIRKGVKKKIIESCERHVFNQSKKILLLSDGLKIFYELKYPSIYKYSIIRHSYKFEDKKKIRLRSTTNNNKLIMVGSINNSNLESVKRLIKCALEIPNTSVYLRTGTHKSILKKAGLADKCTFVPRLKREELLEFIQSSTALLLPHGFKGKLSPAEYKTIFPTKTVEYLISGKPIIAHCPRSSFLYQFLKEKDCALTITSKKESYIKDKMTDYFMDKSKQRRHIENALNAASLFDGLKIKEELTKALITK